MGSRRGGGDRGAAIPAGGGKQRGAWENRANANGTLSSGKTGRFKFRTLCRKEKRKGRGTLNL
jgi:hypothetical protein